jgi:nitroreductase
MDAPFDLETTDRLLSTTRAVRRRLDLDRPVERGILLDCIRLAQQAPTAGNSQTWSWVVVDDEKQRARLGDLYRSLGGGARERAREIYGSDPQTERVLDSAEYLMENLHRVPVHVIPCVRGRLERPSNATAAMLYGSILPAVWSFQLALRSRGLGSTLTTLHLVREEEAREILGIPDGVSQVALLPVAYTRGLDFKPARRPPPESITHWNRWRE